MNIVIFTPNLNRRLCLVKEIVLKLERFTLIESYHDDAQLVFPRENIIIDIRKADLAKTGGLRPDYYLLDDGCDYEFCKSIPYAIERKGNERLFSMRHLIMKIVEIILYGKEDQNED